jgi:hypothetical protein
MDEDGERCWYHYYEHLEYICTCNPTGPALRREGFDVYEVPGELAPTK